MTVRYVRWAADAAADIENRLERGEPWQAAFDAVADDLRAALSRIRLPGPDGLGHRLARSLGHLAYARRFLAEAIAHNEAAAARAPIPARARPTCGRPRTSRWRRAAATPRSACCWRRPSGHPRPVTSAPRPPSWPTR